MLFSNTFFRELNLSGGLVYGACWSSQSSRAGLLWQVPVGDHEPPAGAPRIASDP